MFKHVSYVRSDMLGLAVYTKRTLTLVYYHLTFNIILCSRCETNLQPYLLSVILYATP